LKESNFVGSICTKEGYAVVQFLNATQTFGEIQSIINQAENGTPVVMISPYLKVSDLILSRLIDAGRNRNVFINMICRENALKNDERIRLEQIPNLNLASDEHVHAKCFYNNECMVIGSLNLYDTSAGNHEMGVLLRKDLDSDRDAFQAAKKEAQFILRNAKPYFSQNQEVNFQKNEFKPVIGKQFETKVEIPDNGRISEMASQYTGISNKKTKGYCIHCGIEIPFDKDAPYCTKCWKTWNRYKKRDYPESICHSCGRDVKTSMNDPVCPSCLH
jgi:Zn finger protein HypA/HybF involved in hydrogenase expression